MIDRSGSFVGWQAITLIRVALDQTGEMRGYFFNFGNGSGQDRSRGVIVSTRGRGGRFGEEALPFAQFAARTYLFHDDGLPPLTPVPAPDEAIEKIAAMGRASRAAGRAEI